MYTSVKQGSQGFMILNLPVNGTLIKRETVLLLKEQYVTNFM